MARVITLLDLANLAMKKSEIGVVNCRALQTLINAMLKHLNIEHEKVEIPEEEWSMYQSPGEAGKVEEERQEAQHAAKTPAEDQCLEKQHGNEDAVCKDPKTVLENYIKAEDTGLGLQESTVDDIKKQPVLQETYSLHRGDQDPIKERKQELVLKTTSRLIQRAEIPNQKVVKPSKINLQLSNISEIAPPLTGFMTVSQRSVGRNSLSFPLHGKLQDSTLSAHQESGFAAHKQEETNICGSDGKMYRGRVDAPLPPLNTKDADNIKKHPVLQEINSLHRGVQDLKKDRKQELMQKALDKTSEIRTREVYKPSKLNFELGNISEKIPEKVPRSCGGRHTMTFQRHPKQQGTVTPAFLESMMTDMMKQQVEIKICGIDGNLYRGRVYADDLPV